MNCLTELQRRAMQAYKAVGPIKHFVSKVLVLLLVNPTAYQMLW